jgi:hypothetical protein
MTGHIALLSVLFLLLSPAFAQTTCKEVREQDETQAETAICLLTVDGKKVINERCRIGVAPDGRQYDIDNGRYFARVSYHLDRRDRRKSNISWNGGTGQDDKLVSLGPVVSSDYTSRPDAMCWRNKRVEMCMSEFMRCEP